MIPYGTQDINQADIDAVVNVLKSPFLTQGPVVPHFEKIVAKYCSVERAVAVTSATSALHIACLSLGLKKGDRLWTSAVSFVASANCGLYCDATVDFIDIDPKTYNLCPVALEEKLINAENLGKLPKVLIAVHLCGQSCDLESIYSLSQKYGFKIIEDASHAIGGKYKGKLIGNCEYSDITVFSFHPVKIITTAEGGMALTNNHEYADKMELLRSHGITRNEKKMTKQSDGPWYYQQIGLGFNYRMNDLQAALGISQIGRIDSYVEKRHDIAHNYSKALTGLPITLPWQHPETSSAWHLYVIRLQLDKIKKSHLKVFNELREFGIGVNLHYIPIYLQPYYNCMGFKAIDFQNSENYYKEAISIPIFQTLSKDKQNIVIESLQRVLS